MGYSALDYLKAMRIRTQIRQSFRDMFANVDLLVAPTKLSLPDRADQPFDETPPKHPDQKGVVAGLVQASNLAGLPAMACSLWVCEWTAYWIADCRIALFREPRDCVWAD